jgi:hypothetical protein
VWGERGETVLLCAAVLRVLSGPAQELQPRLRQVAAQVSLFLTKCGRKKMWRENTSEIKWRENTSGKMAGNIREKSYREKKSRKSNKERQLAMIISR